MLLLKLKKIIKITKNSDLSAKSEISVFAPESRLRRQKL